MIEGRYKVGRIDRAEGILHLRGRGGSTFRVQLGPKKLAEFAEGMDARLRRSPNGGLLLEINSAVGREWSGDRKRGEAAERQRRDRRAAPRVEFAGSATVTAGTKTLQCKVRDISERGIALRLPKHEQLEGPLELAFRLPRVDRLLQVSGSVTRVSRTASEDVWGVGFAKAPDELVSALQLYIGAANGDRESALKRHRLDHRLSNLYQDAMAGLEDDSKT